MLKLKTLSRNKEPDQKDLSCEYGDEHLNYFCYDLPLLRNVNGNTSSSSNGYGAGLPSFSNVYGNTSSNSKGTLLNSVYTGKQHAKGIWLMHYCSSHKILLVGEGDFSFSVCLAKAFGSAVNMMATSLDSIEFLRENYPSAESNIGYLKKRGCTVLHGVDATILNFYPDVKFDRIVFNFPLAGFFRESPKQSIKRNRRLVRLFMERARSLIAYDGEIHITHKTSASYREWDIENLAKQSGLRLIEEVEFKLSHYRGYHNKYGFGGNENFHCYPSMTYKFGLSAKNLRRALVVPH